MEMTIKEKVVRILEIIDNSNGEDIFELLQKEGLYDTELLYIMKKNILTKGLNGDWNTAFVDKCVSESGLETFIKSKKTKNPVEYYSNWDLVDDYSDAWI